MVPTSFSTLYHEAVDPRDVDSPYAHLWPMVRTLEFDLCYWVDRMTVEELHWLRQEILERVDLFLSEAPDAQTTLPFD
jgi:hypothetical protein